MASQIESDGEVVEECGICSEELKEEQYTVCCEGICARKLHITCAGINVSAAELVDSSINISYVCSNCSVLTPRGLNNSIKELADLCRNNEKKIQKNIDEIIFKQDNLNSSIKLYMKDILMDVKWNKKSLEKITTAMKTLFESCHEDKQTLCMITSHLKGKSEDIKLFNDKIDKVEKQISNLGFEKHFVEFNSTLECMAEITTNLIETGLQRHSEIVSQARNRVKGKTIKLYRKVINSSIHKNKPKKDDSCGRDAKQLEIRKNIKLKRVRDSTAEEQECRIMKKSKQVVTEVDEMIEENQEHSSTENEYSVPVEEAVRQKMIKKKKEIKSQIKKPEVDGGELSKSNVLVQPEAKKILIHSNKLVSKKDSLLNLQILDYNESVQKYMEFEENLTKENLLNYGAVKDRKVHAARIKVVGIHDNIRDFELVAKLAQQNGVLQDCEMKIVKMNRSKRVRGREQMSTYNAIVELNQNVHTKILQLGKVNLGFTRCKVIDAISVIRCFNCSGYNHLAKNCTKRRACPRCAEDHSIKDCQEQFKLAKCINCYTSNKIYNCHLDVNHTTWDSGCQVYIRKLEIRKKMLNYKD